MNLRRLFALFTASCLIFTRAAQAYSLARLPYPFRTDIIEERIGNTGSMENLVPWQRGNGVWSLSKIMKRCIYMNMYQGLALAGVVMALAACGGGGDSAVAPTATATASVSTSLSAAAVTSPAGTVVLTITISNVGTSAVSGGAFTVPLPAGGKSSSEFAVGSPCTANSFGYGNSGFALVGLAVPAGATCTNTLTLTPSTPGTFVFTPTGLTSVTEGTTATLTIN